MRILVTGAAGFIGSNFVEYLLDRKYSVRAIDIRYGNNLLEFEQNPQFEFVNADITVSHDVDMICKNIDAICHFAAVVSVPESILDPMKTHLTNINGFVNILNAAKNNNIKRIVFASSSAVYGNDALEKKVENCIGTQLSPYGMTKFVNELYGTMFSRLYNLECIGLRYFNVYGPKQNPNGAYAAVIPKFIQSFIQSDPIKPIIVNGDGSNSRDFIYIEDVCLANYLALTTNNPNCYGSVFNIGTGSSTTILELLETLSSITNRQIEPIFGPKLVGDIKYSTADIETASSELKFVAKTDLSTGLKKTINSFEKNNQQF